MIVKNLILVGLRISFVERLRRQKQLLVHQLSRVFKIPIKPGKTYVELLEPKDGLLILLLAIDISGVTVRRMEISLKL